MVKSYYIKLFFACPQFAPCQHCSPPLPHDPSGNRPLLSSKTPHFKKKRPSAEPFMWKWALFAWKWKIIFISKAEHLASPWNRGLRQLGNDLLNNNFILFLIYRSLFKDPLLPYEFPIPSVGEVEGHFFTASFRTLIQAQNLIWPVHPWNMFKVAEDDISLRQPWISLIPQTLNLCFVIHFVLKKMIKKKPEAHKVPTKYSKLSARQKVPAALT